jgi:hypothetical protein
MKSMNLQKREPLRLSAGVGLLLLIAVASLTIPGAALAQEEAHFDVLLYDDGAGNLRTGAIDVGTITPDLGNFAIEGEFFGDSTAGTPSYQGATPGFYSVSDSNVGVLGGLNQNLPGGAAISLDFLVEPTLNISLAYWDDGLGQFGATPNNETLTITEGASFFGSLGGTTEVTGVSLGLTSASTGFFDNHADYDLGAGTAGVYLAYAQANVAGFSGPSNPFWLVFGTLDGCEETASCSVGQEAFNAGIETQIGAGISYVNATLVPEPGTALLFGLGLMGLGSVKRQKRI